MDCSAPAADAGIFGVEALHGEAKSEQSAAIVSAKKDAPGSQAQSVLQKAQVQDNPCGRSGPHGPAAQRAIVKEETSAGQNADQAPRLSHPSTGIVDRHTGTHKQRSIAASGKPSRNGSSAYKGVTRHTTTGRFEAHLWDSSYARPKTVRCSFTRIVYLQMRSMLV